MPSNAKSAFDAKWVVINLGVWMFGYFKHDRSYVLNAENSGYTLADGKQVSVSRRPSVGKIAELVATLRQRLNEGALDRYNNGQEKLPRTVDFGFVEDRPSIVSVMPLVSDTGELPQATGTEHIVSVRFLDSSFLPDIAAANLLKGVRYSKVEDLAANEQSYSYNASGEAIGYFIWKPEKYAASLSGRPLEFPLSQEATFVDSLNSVETAMMSRPLRARTNQTAFSH